MKKAYAFLILGLIAYTMAFLCVKSPHTVLATEEYSSPISSVTPSPSVIPKPTTSPTKAYTEEERLRNIKELAAKIDRYVKNDPAWRKATVGMYIQTLDGDVIYTKNPNLPMIPASNLKIVTTAAALCLLGRDYQFETSVWATPPDENGVIEGNLYIRGTGDPTFMEPFMKNPTAVFHKFARALKKRGVKVIKGDVVGDDSAFDREFLGRGWKVRYLLYDYAAPAGALSINGNCVRLIIYDGKVSMLPGNGYIQIIYKPTSKSYVTVTRKLGTDRVTVRGYSRGKVYRNITVNNPSMFTTSVFARVLKVHGIKITGKVRLISSEDEGYQDRCQELVIYKSVPLYKIVHQINTESDNICAQHLFKEIGYKVKGKGTCDNSEDAIKEWMEENGIDASGFAMADGNGLSVYNRISPHQLVEILVFMKNSPHWKDFWNSLPIAGKTGTLEERLYGIPCRAKTGGLKGHIALSGYVTTRAGQTVVFSFLTNRHHHWGDRIRQNEDYIVKLIASYNKKL